jgi:hypothetical protein
MYVDNHIYEVYYALTVTSSHYIPRRMYAPKSNPTMRRTYLTLIQSQRLDHNSIGDYQTERSYHGRRLASSGMLAAQH